LEELIPISVTVGDRSYRIKVEPQNEETVRKTAKFINDKLVEFKQQFAGKDMQDYIAMVLIWYATQNAQEVQGQLVGQDLTEGFARLEGLLNKGLAAFAEKG
jgi:cell division protein ZapA (FtsZ GTPase activity inhibitor)